MKATIAAIALALSALSVAAFAGTPYENAQTPNVVIQNQQAPQGRLGLPPADAAISVRQGNQERMTVTTNGDVQFAENATIDFADEAPAAGQFKGWVVIRVAGELRVMPSYAIVRGSARLRSQAQKQTQTP